MPLKNGCGASVSHNIAKLIREGKKRDQAVAIALDHARSQGCDEGKHSMTAAAMPRKKKKKLY